MGGRPCSGPASRRSPLATHGRERMFSGLPPKAELRCARSRVRALNRGSAARRHRTAGLSACSITVSPVGKCNEEGDPSDIVLFDIAAADGFGA